MADKETSSAPGEETELKKELQRGMEVILKEDDCGTDMVIKCVRILSRLAELKLQQSVGTLSGSDQLQILRWCEEHGVAPLKVDHYKERDPMADKHYINSFLNRLSSLYDQKEVAKELQRLTKTIPSCRAVFSEFPDGITKLLDPLSLTKFDSDPELQEDLIATVLNISTDDNNKNLLVEHPVVIPLLVEHLKSGTSATKRNAAAAIFTLSTLNSNKYRIGNFGALEPLLELLRVGYPLEAKEAASAILSLCEVFENKAKLTELGAVKLIIQKMSDGILVDELSSILALLSQHPDAIDEFEDPKIFKPFVEIRKKCTSELVKKNCATILHNFSRAESRN